LPIPFSLALGEDNQEKNSHQGLRLDGIDSLFTSCKAAQRLWRRRYPNLPKSASLSNVP
jgi:hypothetical protein